MCRKYEDCDWRKSVGYCPENCNHFKHRDEVVVVRCKDCVGRVWDEEFRTYYCDIAHGMYGDIEEDSFCSYGERRNDEVH